MARYQTLEQEIILNFRDFSGGVNNKLHPLLLPENQCEKLDNLDISIPGIVKSRLGYQSKLDDLSLDTRVGAGLYDYLKDDGTHTLLLWQSDLSAGNGNFGFFEWNGSASTWTAQGADDFDVTSSTGALDEIFGLPFKDLMIFVNSVTGAAIDWDGSTLAGNIHATDASNDDFFPSGHIMASWLGRVFVSGNSLTMSNQFSSPKPGFVWPSKIFDPVDGKWSRTSRAFRVGQGNGCHVRALLPIRNREMIVFCNNTIHAVLPPINMFSQTAFGHPTAENFPVQEIHPSIGCGSGKTAKLVGEDIIFMDQYGNIRRLSRTQLEQNRGVVGLPISDPIQGYIDRINKIYLGLCTAFVSGRNYYISVPLDSATSLSHTLVFDVPLGVWMGIRDYSWSNYVESSVEDTINDSEKRIYVLDGTTNIQMYEIESGNSDDGTAIGQTFQHKRLDFGLPNTHKIGKTLWMYFVASGNADVEVFASPDGGGFQVLEGSPINLSGNAGSIPTEYPYTLGGGGVIRKSFRLTDLGRWTDLEIKWTQSGLDSSGSVIQTEFLGYSISAVPASPRRS